MKIGSKDKVHDYVNQEFDAGRVIFGLGHAVYDTDDPRAPILVEMIKRIGEKSGDTKWYDISTLLEKNRQGRIQEAQKQRHLRQCRFLQRLIVLFHGDPD
jgi:citrate synthase